MKIMIPLIKSIMHPTKFNDEENKNSRARAISKMYISIIYYSIMSYYGYIMMKDCNIF